MASKVGNMNELRDLINSKINEVLQNEVKELVKNTVSESINEVVYSSYSPTKYNRRGTSGGLADENNVHSELTGEGELTTNISATSNNSVVDGSTSGDLAKWIVYGNVPNIFNDKSYPWMYPRDFVQDTVDKLNDGRLAKTFKSALVSRGIK